MSLSSVVPAKAGTHTPCKRDLVRNVDTPRPITKLGGYGFRPSPGRRSEKLKAPMLTEASDYDELYRDFRWEIPARFNIATACCDRHADGTGRLALIYVDEDGAATRDLVRRDQRDVAPLRQCAEGGWPRARRPRRGVPVAVAGIADRASGRVSLRHGVGAAVHAVRRGCAGISPRQFRRQGHRHRRERLGETGEDPRPPAWTLAISTSSALPRMPAPNRSGPRSRRRPPNLRPSIPRPTIPP